MPLAVKRAAGTRTRTVLDPETIVSAASADLAAIGHDYLARARHHRRREGARFIDKFPGNFQYAGFIAQALPQARIVCLRRHPMDTVLSNFRNLFAISSRYYDYSYDLIDIARYYARFHRLMAFWQEALPGRILEVSYEALVADQEGEPPPAGPLRAGVGRGLPRFPPQRRPGLDPERRASAPPDLPRRARPLETPRRGAGPCRGVLCRRGYRHRLSLFRGMPFDSAKSG
jgi:hypothetical protein